MLDAQNVTDLQKAAGDLKPEAPTGTAKSGK